MTWQRRLLVTGLALFMAGGLILGWYIFKRHSGSGDWQIQVEGNRVLTEKELQEVVLYLLRAAKDGVSSEEIRDALLLNSRIATAKATILPGRRINISITERVLEHMQNEGSGIAEKDAAGSTIVENAAQLHKDLTPDKVIFYLTFRTESMTAQASPKSDIIRLWKDTQRKYAFLWQRLAEIEIRPLKENSNAISDPTGKTGIWRYRIYSAGIRSCVVYEGRFSEETLRRLWAVYAYLEAKLPRSVTLVDLQENSAIIREMKQAKTTAEAGT